ncbi:hypothetical protein UFOVP229_86 [uncultured Caudovirales phage]|uniref:Uncharacterized protein n=1 Tax=uncultured Caudovirales phage TaxID=2100421 RepID=A0A6J7WRX8_9CAUD|nr:hypothetical protein UFOVP229_86 [uncultured Caudovirales phage]
MALESLQTTEQPEDTAALRPGAKGNVSVGGLKNVSLEGAQSSDIRERLMQMIAERERGNPMQEALGHLALAGSAPGEFNRNYSDYLTRKRQQEQDLFGMRVSAAQLSSEEERLKREAAEQQRVAQMFGMGQKQAPAPAGGGVFPTQGADTMTSAAPSTGGLGLSAPTQQGPGMEGQPAGGLSAVRPQTAFAASPSEMSPLQAQIATMSPAEQYAMYSQGRDPKTRNEMYKQLATRFAPSETERLAAAAGLQPGTPEYSAFMRMKIAGSGAYAPHDVRTPFGTQQATPLQSAIGSIVPQAPAPQPMGSNQAPTSQPMGSMQPAAPAAAAAPARAPAATGFAPGSAEDLKIRQRQQEIEQDISKEAAIESGKKIDVPDQKALTDAVSSAPGNLTLSTSLIKDIQNNQELFGKLMRPGMFSAFANLVDSGVQFGQFGSLNVPGVKNFIQQLSPEVQKDPAKLDAWNRVLGNMAKVNLNFARIAYQGQGAVSNFEREMISTAIGDPSRDSAANLLMKAQVIQAESHNALEKNKLWEQNRAKNMTWTQFKESPQYKALERDQFYRTAKILKLKDAKWPGDE